MDTAGVTRRQACQFALGGLALSAAPAGALSALMAPTGPCVLTRRLKRGLRDTKFIAATRSWEVTFARQSRGMAVRGEQISVLVEAPERLAPLAKIEQERSTDEMFPILLAGDGLIVAAG